jgi:hypothetical protein
MAWPELDPRACPYCLGAGIFPLVDVPDRTEWAVCLCVAGKAWRYDRQIDRKRKEHRVAPLWQIWASEWDVPVRSRVLSGSIPDTGSCIDLIERYYSPTQIAEMFPQRRIA